MTPEEQAKKIREICDGAMRKIEELGRERRDILRGYVRELEGRKADAIRASLDL